MSGIECPMCTNVPGLGGGKCDSGKVPKVNCSDGLDLCMSLKGKMTFPNFTQSIELKNCSNDVLCDSASDFNGTNSSVRTMRILKFKSQLTTAFFAAVNHLNGPLRKQNFTLRGSKGHGLWFVIGGFRSVLRVSVFQGSLLVIVIMIDGSEKRNCEGGVWTLEFACLWKAQ